MVPPQPHWELLYQEIEQVVQSGIGNGRQASETIYCLERGYTPRGPIFIILSTLNFWDNIMRHFEIFQDITRYGSLQFINSVWHFETLWDIVRN